MELFGVKIDSVTLREALNKALSVVASKRSRPFFIVTPNPEQVVLAQTNSGFRDALNKADLAIPDGFGLVIASRILSRKHEARNPKHEKVSNFEFRTSNLPERVSGVELMEQLIKAAGEKGWKVMLVGGLGDTAARAAKKLTIQYSIFNIRGVEGMRDVRKPSRREEQALITTINGFGPELLFVGFGAPWQERWVAKNQSTLQTRLVMVVGGALDQIVDPTLRPPQVFDRIGLGWAYRLVRQPWRLKRQLKLFTFGWMVLKAVFKRSLPVWG